MANICEDFYSEDGGEETRVEFRPVGSEKRTPCMWHECKQEFEDPVQRRFIPSNLFI